MAHYSDIPSIDLSFLRDVIWQKLLSIVIDIGKLFLSDISTEKFLTITGLGPRLQCRAGPSLGRARAEPSLNCGTRPSNYVRLQWWARPGLNFNLSIFCRSGAMDVNKRLLASALGSQSGRCMARAICNLFTHVLINTREIPPPW